MRARTLAYLGMALSPLYLTAYVALSARALPNDYEPIAYNAEQEARVEAYEPVISGLREYRANSILHAPESAVRPVLERWSEDARDGRLQRLVPICVEDGLEVPVRQEIVTTAIWGMRWLVSSAERRLEIGDVAGAMQDAERAITIAQPLRYSDVETLAWVGPQQDRAFALIDRHVDQMSPATRAKMLDLLGWAERTRVPFTTLALHSRNLYVDHLRRMGQDVSRIETAGAALRARADGLPDQDLVMRNLYLAAREMPPLEFNRVGYEFASTREAAHWVKIGELQARLRRPAPAIVP